jgi:hypothetical protein
MGLQAYDQSMLPTGTLQIASFTEDSNGNLSSSNTAANMPHTEISEVNPESRDVVLSMSPSGKLLAVGGNGGLQVFHFNGARPVTTYTGLLTTEFINQIFWDNNNHLYAISYSADKLYVFGVTPTWHGVAPGSPYTIQSPRALIVQPTPWY